MSYIVYPKLVDNRDLLVNMLVKQKIPIHLAAKKIKVSYGCMLHQAKKLLSKDEFEAVIENRARRRYSQSYRMKILRQAAVRGVAKVAERHGISPILIRAWRRKYSTARVV